MTIENKRRKSFLNSKLSKDTLTKCIQCLLYNCSARVEMNDQAIYSPVGSGTECAFLKMLQENEIAVHEEIRKKKGKVQAHIPFSPIRKKETIALVLPG